MRAEGRPVDVIHAHDWEGAPAILRCVHHYGASAVLGQPGTVLTCHNLAYHGWVTRDQVGPTAGPARFRRAAGGRGPAVRGHPRRRHGEHGQPRVCARVARLRSTARASTTALRYRGDRYVGILNGIDTELWDPATDAEIPAATRPTTWRARHSAARRCATSSASTPDGPVFAMVSRLDPQKGFDLVAAAAYEMLSDGARVCVLGTGDRISSTGCASLAPRSRLASRSSSASTAAWRGGCTPARTAS